MTWRQHEEETGHGMILVAVRIKGPETDMALATCVCGWFSSSLNDKVDMAAADWRKHMEDV